MSKQHLTPRQLKTITFEFAEEILSKIKNNKNDILVKRKDWSSYHHKKFTIGVLIHYLIAEGCKITIDKKIVIEHKYFDILYTGLFENSLDLLFDTCVLLKQFKTDI